MRSLVMGVVAVLWASAALAADEVEIGPPAAWIKAGELPKPDPAQTGDAQILFSDHQDRFSGDTQDSYIRNVFYVRTPQGLAALSNMTVSWRPDTDTVTVHHLRLIRGDKVIDVLADQTFTVMRRETNLELAMLSGELTAALQPEGLEAGDLVDFAYTIKRHDPTLQGKSELLSGFNLPIPVGRLRVREVFAPDKTPRWRVTTGLPAPTVSRTAQGTELVADVKALEPIKPPALAPARYGELRQIEVTDFTSWSEVAALTAPLFAKAMVLKPDSPLHAQAAKIAAASADPKARAAAALKLVEDKVRYVYLGMNLGGYVPASADQTWARRFGDCKGKTVVLLALLKELGVEAEPALISVAHGDGLDQRLPMLEVFDHVMVRARIDGKSYWLDATRTGDRSLDDIAVPNFKWALPVRPAGAVLERLVVAPLSEPTMEARVDIDASGGLDKPAPVHAAFIYRGDVALTLRAGLANLGPADLETKLKEIWKDSYDWIEPAKVSAVFDDATSEEVFSIDGTAKIGWFGIGWDRREYQLDGADLGWKADFARAAGPDSDAPFAVEYPSFVRTGETIQLPGGGIGFEVVGADVDTRTGGIEFKRSTRIDHGVMTMEASSRAVSPEFPASEAPAVEKALRAMNEVSVYLKTPELKTKFADDAEIDQALAAKPTTASGFASRAAAFLERHENDKALADFDKAVALEPGTGLYLRLRGFAHLQNGELREGMADFESALKLTPKDSNALRGQGFGFLRQGRYAEAVKSFDASLAIEPDNGYCFKGRGQARIGLHELEAAITDLAEAERINPDDLESYYARAEALAQHDQPQLADAEFDKMAARRPHAPEVFALRGQFLARHDRKPEAVKAYDQAIAIKPTAQLYLQRAFALPQTDRAGRMADVDRAQALEPKSPQAHQARAVIYTTDKDYDAAARELEAAMLLAPQDTDIVVRHIEALRRGGKQQQARAEFDRLIAAHPGDARLLNARCWFRGIGGDALEGALADCDAALKIIPDFGEAFDSRGLVELKLGRLDQAIADYDTSLKLRPKLAESLFGRGLAKLRAGRTQDGQADLAAARASDPKIDEEFADYGLKP